MAIQSVLDVKDDNPVPKGAGSSTPFNRSILVLTPQMSFLEDLHFRPLLPSKAGPLVGCLLLHIMDPSYDVQVRPSTQIVRDGRVQGELGGQEP
jgi:hypothetical protein